jgi:protein gp37
VRDTDIEWCDDTWNVMRGCSRTIAEGAETSGCGDPTGGGCYAERNGWRYARPGMAYEGLVRMTPHGARWTGQVLLIDNHLLDPIRWGGNRSIFTTSVSDPFHERFSNETIAVVYGAMAASPQHTHMLLTKRVQRARQWYAWVEAQAAAANDGRGMSPAAFCFCLLQKYVTTSGKFAAADHKLVSRGRVVSTALAARWPLDNLWTGASVEHQAAATARIDDLLHIPSALHWLSCEPLLGQIDLLPWFDPSGACCGSAELQCQGCPARASWRGIATQLGDLVSIDPAIGWVVAGCESGHGARGVDSEAYRLLRDRCRDARVPFFLKQAREEVEMCEEGCGERVRYEVMGQGTAIASCGCTIEGGEVCTPVGIGCGEGSKRKGGGVIGSPYLDGEQHLQRPVMTRNAA